MNVKKEYLFAIVILIMLIICGCIEKEDMPSKKSEAVLSEEKAMNAEEVKKFMIDNYNLSEDELDGVDVVRFANDYQIFSRNYSPDEIREILVEEADSYQDDGTTTLYSILEETSNNKVTKDTQITCIAYLYNEGTFYQRGVYDLSKEIYYMNDAKPHVMDTNHKKTLDSLIDEYEISRWELDYRGEEEPTTGSLEWKVVFVDSKGSKYVYSGYTQDGTHLPDNFKPVMNVLLKPQD